MPLARPFRYGCFVLLLIGCHPFSAYAGPAETAAEWLIEQANTALPGQFSYQKLQAGFNGPIIFEKLRYDDGDTLVAIDYIELDWSLGAILSRTAKIELLQVRGVELRLPPPSEEPQPDEPSGPITVQDISLPIAVDIQKVDIQNVSIYPHGVLEPIVIDHIQLKARTEDNAVVLDNFSVKMPQASASLRGRLQPIGDYPLDFQIEWTYQNPQFGAFDGSGKIGGNLQKLLLTQQIAGPVKGAIRASLASVLTDPQWDADLQLATADLGPFAPELAGVSLETDFTSSGKLSDFAAQGNLQSGAIAEVGAITAGFDISGNNDAIQISRLVLQADASPMALNVQGRVGLTDQQLALNGRWQALTWPLAGPAQIAVPEGSIRLDGSLQDYRMELDTLLQGEVFGDLQALARLSGNQQAMTIEQLQVRAPGGELAVNAEGDLTFADLGFTVSGNWQALAWPLAGVAQYRSPNGRFEARGTPADYHATINARLTGNDIGLLDADITAAGSDRALRDAKIVLRQPQGPLQVDLNGSFGFVDLDFMLSGQWTALAWPLQGQAQIRSPGGQLRAEGSPQAYSANLSAELLGPQQQMVAAKLQAQGNPQVFTLHELSLSTPGAGPQLSMRAEVMLDDLAFSAEGDWRDLVWPLSGTPQVQVPRGTFTAIGGLEDYSFELQTEVSGADIPSGRWTIQGLGSDKEMKQLDLTGRVLEGELNAQLSAQWQPDIRWQGAIRGNQLNIGSLLPQLPGVLGFSTHSEGSLQQEQLQALVEIDSLSGELAGQALSGVGKMQIDGEQIAIEALQLSLGDSEVDISGELAEQWSIDWRIALSGLNRLLPELAGSLRGQGSIEGPREQPQVGLNLNGNGLAYGEERIERLQAQGIVDVSGARPSQLEVTAQSMQLGGQAWNSLTLTGSGTPDEHTADLGLRGELGRFALALAGGVQQDIWRGRLDRLDLLATLAGDWRLAEPVAISANAEQAELGRLCLRSAPSRVCAQGGWSAGSGGQAELSLDNLRPDRFAEFFPENLTLETALSGTASGSFATDGSYSATAELNLAPGRLGTQVNGNPLTLTLVSGSIQAQADQDAADGSLAIDLGDLGQLDSKVQLSELATQPRVQGRINGSIDDLSIVEILAPQAENVSGRVIADLNLNGTLPVPVISGSLRLADAAADVPFAGLAVRDIQFAAIGDGSGNLRINGGAQSGSGRLELSGLIDSGAGSVDIQVGGQRFQVMNTTEIQVEIAPDLSLAIADGLVAVDGEIVIPQANISPPKLPDSGVGVSDDVVIITGEAEQQSVVEQAAQAVSVSVRVTLGNDVYVSVFGFNGQLIGSLLLEQSAQLGPRATGNIGVKRGTYEIYGQELDIERGQVLFSGGPVDNPGLDLRIVRVVGDITAGAQVRGTLKQPDFKLFSVPAMPDSSILSYLVFGSPPGDNQNALTSAALALGAAGGNLVTRDIASAAGLDTLSFQSGDTAEETSLQIGKYLTPQLYIGYGVGLFDKLNTFNMRYEFSRWLHLESESNAETTGADVIYVIER